MKTLLVITTLNHIKYTEKCIKSIPEINNLDILFVDDYSKDNTISMLEQKGLDYIPKDKGAGLTDSWNIGYRRFKQSYDKLIISNNDVLFSKPSLENLIGHLDKHTLCCPMTSAKGAGHNAEFQDVARYYPKLKDISSHETRHTKIINRLDKHEVVKMKRFNGFCFAVNKDIINSEYDKEHLFNPKSVNTGQESDLSRRLHNKPVVCLDSFIFHFKAITVRQGTIINKRDSRDRLERYH